MSNINPQWILGHSKIGNNFMAHAEKEAFGFLFNEQVATISDTFNVMKPSTCDNPII